MNRVCIISVCTSCSATLVAYRINPLKSNTWAQHPSTCPILPFLAKFPLWLHWEDPPSNTHMLTWYLLSPCLEFSVLLASYPDPVCCTSFKSLPQWTYLPRPPCLCIPRALTVPAFLLARVIFTFIIWFYIHRFPPSQNRTTLNS